MDDSEFPADAALIAAANDGDGQSFGRLYDRHRDRVFRHVLRLSDSIVDAEDLVSLVFAEAWRKRRTIRVVSETILPWLLVTANNLARNNARAKRRYQSFLARIPHPPHEPDHADAVIDRMARRVQHAAMRSAFDASASVIARSSPSACSKNSAQRMPHSPSASGAAPSNPASPARRPGSQHPSPATSASTVSGARYERHPLHTAAQ